MVFNGENELNVALIPARGGSKRIPRKNIKLFNNKPIIAWAIDLAIHSKLFSKVIVSTDDDEIAEIARSYGAEVPFIRPKNISDDHSTIHPVILHGIDYLSKLNIDIKIACCIFPCTPLLKLEYLEMGYNKLISNMDKYVYAISKYPHPIERAMKKNNINGDLEYIMPENELVRTQDLKETYFDCGQFYWGTVDIWRSVDKIHSNAIGIELPKLMAIDIDTIDDWERAELIKSMGG